MNKTVFFNKFRRLFGFVLTISLLGNVFAASAQNARISIKMENVPISQVIKEIENQTRYLFINKGVDTKNKVSINAVQKTIQDVLAQLFAGTEIAYRIDESYIILTKKNDAGNPVSVTGKIRDAKGNPIVGASILVQGTTIGVSSDADGAFALQVPPPAADRQLEISFIGYTPVSIVVGSRTSFEITLEEAASEIEQVVVTALGIKRSEKAVAYNVQQIKAEDITTVKDANFINSLSGKVAGAVKWPVSRSTPHRQVSAVPRRSYCAATSPFRSLRTPFTLSTAFRCTTSVVVAVRSSIRAVLRNPSQTSTPRILSRCRC